MKTRTLVIAAIILLVSVSAGLAVFRRQQRIHHLQARCVAEFHQKNWQELEDLAREWSQIQSAPGSYYWLGLALKEQKQFEAAFRAFEQVPLIGPRGIEAAIERVEIQFHVFQQPLKAIGLAQRLLELDPKLASPRRHMIYFHAMMIHRPELLKQIRLAIEHHVDLPEHYVYAITMEDLDFRDADEVTRKWMEATPEFAEFRHANLARRVRTIRGLMLKSPTPEATERYAAIRSEIVPQLRELGSVAVALDTLLLLAMDDGEVDEAGRLLSLVPDSSVDDPSFWRYRGWYATRTGDLDEAEKAYRHSLALQPLGWQTRHEYANLLRMRGRSSEAGAIQSAAADGPKLVFEIHKLPHASNISFAMLKRIAEYAMKCESREIANGIWRRQQSSTK